MANLRALTLRSSTTSSLVFRGYVDGAAYGPFTVPVTTTAATLTNLMAAASLPQYLFDQIVVSSIDTGTISYNFSGGAESPATYAVGQLAAGGVISPPFDPAAVAADLAALATPGTTVVLPAWAGTITVSSTILMASNTRLIIPPGVTLKRGDGVNHYLLRNAGSDGTYANWDDGNENIYIGGGGSIDLNSANNATANSIAANISNHPGFGIHFYRVDRLVVEDLDIIGADYLGTAYGKYLVATTHCTKFTIQRLSLNNTSDGIHVLGKCDDWAIRNIVGTTTDDLVSITAQDYPSYVIAGTAGDCTNGHVSNITQLGKKSAVKFLGSDTARVYNVSARNIHAEPSETGYSSLYIGGGVHNLSGRNISGVMNGDTPVVQANHDTGPGGTIAISPCSNIKIRNIMRKENGVAGTIGSKKGQCFRAYGLWQCHNLEINGFTCLQSNGTIGYIGDTVGTIDLDVQTSAGGYITHAVVRNGHIVDANSGNGRFLSLNSGVGYNGTAYVGGVKVLENYIAGVTYAIITATGAGGSPAALHAGRVFIEGNTFVAVLRPAQWNGSQIVQWGRNDFAGTTGRINEITVNTVVVSMDSQNVASASCQPYYSSGTPFTFSLAAGSSWQGIGSVTSISGASTIGAFEADIIVCTGTTYTVTLRDGFPGQRKTIRNNASGNITVASSSSGTITGSPVATGTSATFVCTNYRDWTLVGA